jgi:hypothetical protein
MKVQSCRTVISLLVGGDYEEGMSSKSTLSWHSPIKGEGRNSCD